MSGVCSVAIRTEADPVIICPNRLYDNRYGLLRDVAEIAFGPGHTVIHPDNYLGLDHDGRQVIAFGKKFGKELRLPARGGRGNFFVDWVLARISDKGELAEFTALEVQSIDTTGTYRHQVQELRDGAESIGGSPSGLNWENVNKRILPQLIYKGHVLQSEPLCSKGLFFVSPGDVYNRIRTRLGGSLGEYPLQPGSISFLWYSLDDIQNRNRSLSKRGDFSTLVNQVALAFTAPMNLPPPGSYETAIKQEIERLKGATP
ncbi:MAG: NotI family restriction endonuclease [Chloroflexi bacterium]|nr:NotI family restriction endonuclease [Chloroflexota bacterium]